MKKFRKYIIFVVIIIVVIFIIINGSSYAKYVSDSVWNYYLKSKGFYFSSDLLGSNPSKNIDNHWDGSSIYFNINNSLNDNVVSNFDINYKAICTVKGTLNEDFDCYMNNTSSNIYEGVLSSYKVCVNYIDEEDVSLLDKTSCEAGGYLWQEEVANKELYFDVVKKGELDLTDVIVNIEVTSTSPYKKKLSGDFHLKKIEKQDDKINLDYKNYSYYDRLIVSNTYLEDKTVNIKWNADKLRIDVDSESLLSYDYDNEGFINEIEFNINSKDSLSYLFYKTNLSESFNKDDFTVIIKEN